jgi:uncharacterized membrane-anchored protein YjiN (DUF445 family)
VEPIVGSLPRIVPSLESPEFQDFASRALGEQLRNVNVAPLAGHVVRALAASGEADILFERAVEAAHGWLKENRAKLDELVQERSRWWIPKKVDRRIAAAVADSAADLLERLRHPESEARQQYREALSTFISNLIEQPEQQERLSAIKNQLLEHPDVQKWLASIWRDLSGAIVADAQRPQSKVRAALEKAVTSIGRALVADATMQAKVDALAEDLMRLVISRRGEIGAFIAEVVKSWDAQTLSDRLERVIGNDLQYIRMNGTVVGALVGCVIFMVSSLLD